MSAVLKKAVKLNHSLTHSLVFYEYFGKIWLSYNGTVGMRAKYGLLFVDLISSFTRAVPFVIFVLCACIPFKLNSLAQGNLNDILGT